MSILYPTDNPYSATPLNQAYAWIGNLTIDFMSGNGQIQVVVNSDILSGYTGKPPVKVLNERLGEGLPNLQQVLYENAESFGKIRAYLYQKLLELPEFSNGFEIEKQHYAETTIISKPYVLPIGRNICKASSDLVCKSNVYHCRLFGVSEITASSNIIANAVNFTNSAAQMMATSKATINSQNYVNASCVVQNNLTMVSQAD